MSYFDFQEDMLFGLYRAPEQPRLKGEELRAAVDAKVQAHECFFCHKKYPSLKAAKKHYESQHKIRTEEAIARHLGRSK